MTLRWLRTAVLGAAILAIAGCSPVWITRTNVASDGTQANQPSFAGGAISADGRFVAFESFANTLVPNDTNDAVDIFVRDNLTGTTERVSVASDESQGDTPAGIAGAGRELDISPDGRFVVFHASFNDLVAGASGLNVFLRDRVAGTTEVVSIADDESPYGGSFAGAVSGDGRYVSFTSAASNLVPGDTNRVPCDPHEPHCDVKGQDVFVRDRVDGTTQRVSLGPRRQSGRRRQHRLGHERRRKATSRSHPSPRTLWPPTHLTTVMSSCGISTNGTTELVSVAFDGTGNDGSSFAGDMSSDGRFVTFMSDATDLVDGDLDDPFLRRHIYLRDRDSRRDRAHRRPHGRNDREFRAEHRVGSERRRQLRRVRVLRRQPRERRYERRDRHLHARPRCSGRSSESASRTRASNRPTRRRRPRARSAPSPT